MNLPTKLLFAATLMLMYSCNLERIEPGGPGTATKFISVIGDNGENRANDLILTTDGGYLIAGSNQQAGNFQAYLAKLNSKGVVQWERMFGGIGIETAKAVVQAPDGGFVFCGQIANDIYLLKVNANGDKVWEKTYGSVDSTEYGFGIVPSGSSGDFQIAFVSLFGNTQSIGLMKINGNGLKLSSSIVRNGNFYMYRMIKTTDSKLVLVGSEFTSGSNSYVLKLTEAGAYVWENRFPTSNPNFTPSYGITETSNGNLIAAGSDLGSNDQQANPIQNNTSSMQATHKA